MNRVNPENYYTVQGWMLSELKLKGNELAVYAIIYGFSQDGITTFNGGLQYLADWTNSSKQSVSDCLKRLLKKDLIIKEEKNINNIKFCEYRAKLDKTAEHRTTKLNTPKQSR